MALISEKLIGSLNVLLPPSGILWSWQRKPQVAGKNRFHDRTDIMRTWKHHEFFCFDTPKISVKKPLRRQEEILISK